MKRTLFYLTAFFIGLVIWGCSKSDPSPVENPSDTVQQLYFPPLSSAAWETVSPTELEWNLNAETPLQDLLEERGTKAFLMLKDGKIAVEWYFDSFTKDSIWYWASAGKTLTAFTVGLAQEQGFLNLSDRSSQYLGEGWTSAPLEKENLITVRDQLTMSSGLNELFFDCVSPDCLRYLADSGSRWAYHNGPYTLLQQVVANATQLPYSSYFNTELRNKVGMDGFWLSTNGQNNVYFSTARSMARFGLLSLNSGTWEEEVIMSDTAYANEMKNSSQDLNLSYGYLWWLAGKESFRAPGSQELFQGSLIPNAPGDLYAGLGKNDQKLYVIPSQNLVIVRMGEDAGEDLAGPSSFDNQLWDRINAFIN
ncbi:beta-lactamase family protein [Flavobacteriaceae bacterium D16]|nr:beta-lactamase family protein [Flavobacteriaceae bacterium D16]